jgi:DNA-binding XRE family transcriptional regulator
MVMIKLKKSDRLGRVEPRLDELLPTPELRQVFTEASAALEAGRLVRSLREKAGLTQEELADRLDMKQPRVSAIEAGRGRDGPSYALLKRIVFACGGTWNVPAALERSVPKGVADGRSKMETG